MNADNIICCRALVDSYSAVCYFHCCNMFPGLRIVTLANLFDQISCCVGYGIQMPWCQSLLLSAIIIIGIIITTLLIVISLYP